MNLSLQPLANQLGLPAGQMTLRQYRSSPMAEVLAVNDELTVVALENPGQSFASERKRVRLALLRNYAPFLDELVQVAESLRSYDEGPDRAAHAKIQSDWQIEIEIVPTSHFENAVAFDGDPAIEFRENLSRQLSSKNSSEPRLDPPTCLLWDTRYHEAAQCKGRPGIDLQNVPYVVIPVTLSLKEAVALLRVAGVGEQRGYLTNTDESGLAEAVHVLRSYAEKRMSISDTVKLRHPDLDPETFKSKCSRYSKLLKQMLEIIAPPVHTIQQN